MRILLVLIAYIGLTACATMGGGSGQSTNNDSQEKAHSEVPSFRADEPVPPEMKVAEFDAIPNEVNPAVEKWVNYFTGRGREHMERYLSRSTRYEKLMKKILRENGMPEDLLYIALIESGFSPKALSKASAVGYWQFIRGTGRRYGLEISSFVDERRDPVMATQAAADYFKGLYGEFNSWYLSMASYNVGEGRVRREVRKHKTNDFWVLAKKRRLPKETLNYVPKFLAARMIAKDPQHYGFMDLAYEPPIEYDTITLTEPLNLKVMAEKMELDYAEMKRLNPKYRGEIAPIPKKGKLELRVPMGTSQQAMVAALAAKVDQVVFIADRGEADVYKVRRGDNLAKIAKKFKTTVAALKDLNNFTRKSRIRAGRTIFVPLIDDRPMSEILAGKKQEKKSSEELFHVAKSGDTLIEIAEKYDMSLNELRDLNDMDAGFKLKVGARVKVKKIDEGDTASPAEVAANPDIPASQTAEAPAAKPEEVVASVEAKPELAKAEQVAPEEKPEVKTEAKAEEPRTHKVRPGENLSVIARKYGTTVQALKKANNIGRRSVIRAGLVLVIPTDSDANGKPTMNSSSKKLRPVQFHIVRKGDTLIEIAEKYGVKVSDILAHNKAANRNKLYSGVRLKIPSSKQN